MGFPILPTKLIPFFLPFITCSKILHVVDLPFVPVTKIEKIFLLYKKKKVYI